MPAGNALPLNGPCFGVSWQGTLHSADFRRRQLQPGSTRWPSFHRRIRTTPSRSSAWASRSTPPGGSPRRWPSGNGRARTSLEENTRLACRFNAAVNRIGTAPAWGELEEILPSLLALASPVNRTTALLQTARAAIAEGRFPRAGDLLDQAEAILDAELAARHPFRATLYEERASLAAAQGHRKVARQWQKKAASLSAGGGWERGSVSVDDLRKQSRR
jgi:hypothetical protein